MRFSLPSLLLLISLWAGSAHAQVAWVRQAQFDAGLQLPAYRANPAVMAYRSLVVWPLGAAKPRAAEPIFVSREIEYRYSIPREYFVSDAAFRRYYLDNPSRRKRRIPAPPLSDVPQLHRARNTFDFSLSF